jgi:hypothetical protein
MICTDFLASQLQYLIENFCSLLITLEKATEEAWAVVRASDMFQCSLELEGIVI